MDEALIAKYPDLEENHFWWRTRRKLVRHIYESLAEEAAPSVLDVGCGSGVTASMLASAGAQVVGLDSAAGFQAPEAPNGQMEFVRADYLEAFHDLGQFDLVLAMDSVEHFSSETEVISALAANTAPGGRLLVTVPAYGWLWSSHDEENAHYRRYTRRTLASALTRAGMTVDRVGYLFAGLVAPKALLAVVEQILNKELGSGTELSPAINRLATRYFGLELEIAMARKHFLPFGTSVVAVATPSGAGPDR